MYFYNNTRMFNNQLVLVPTPPEKQDTSCPHCFKKTLRPWMAPWLN